MITVANSAFTGVAVSQVLAGSPAVCTSQWLSLRLPTSANKPFNPAATQWLLYAAELRTGNVFVFDGNWNRVTLPAGRFTDSTIPTGFAAYGIYARDHVIYVTYTRRDPFSGMRLCGNSLHRYGFLKLCRQATVLARWASATWSPTTNTAIYCAVSPLVVSI
jgi:hypothetical protein